MGVGGVQQLTLLWPSSKEPFYYSDYSEHSISTAVSYELAALLSGARPERLEKETPAYGVQKKIMAASGRGVYIRPRPIEQCTDSRTARQP